MSDENESTNRMDIDGTGSIDIRGKALSSFNGETNEAASQGSVSGNKGDAQCKHGMLATKSIEGWIIIVTNLHEESTESDMKDLFADFGRITSLHLNLDRRTGFVKGYALIEYATLEEAKEAISQTDGTKFLDKTIHSDFVILEPPQRADRRSKHRSARSRSRSPRRD